VHFYIIFLVLFFSIYLLQSKGAEYWESGNFLTVIININVDRVERVPSRWSLGEKIVSSLALLLIVVVAGVKHWQWSDLLLVVLWQFIGRNNSSASNYFVGRVGE